MATATGATSPAARFLQQPKRMLIDGEWVEARHGRTLEVYDPALGDVIDHVPAGDAEDIDLAVRAARRALEDSDWSRLTASERGRIIWRIGVHEPCVRGWRRRFRVGAPRRGRPSRKES